MLENFPLFVEQKGVIRALASVRMCSHSSEKFGIYAVDFQDPALPRVAKESAKVLAEIIATRKIPERFRD
jgi:beta-glucosidase/6-phospho-beta-glucosidase/beta-galactosidase